MKLKIGKNLAELRTRYHYTQDDLSEKLGVSSNTVSAWETDQTRPSLEHMIALTNLFEISLDALVCPKEENENTFPRRFIPFRFIRTTGLGYYPETYVDYTEDLENGLYTAWLWTSYYPYKRSAYSLPVKHVSIDDFMSFIQDHADSFLNQFFKELEKLMPKEEVNSVYENILTIAAHEEIADTAYDLSNNDGS